MARLLNRLPKLERPRRTSSIWTQGYCAAQQAMAPTADGKPAACKRVRQDDSCHWASGWRLCQFGPAFVASGLWLLARHLNGLRLASRLSSELSPRGLQPTPARRRSTACATRSRLDVALTGTARCLTLPCRAVFCRSSPAQQQQQFCAARQRLHRIAGRRHRPRALTALAWPLATGHRYQGHNKPAWPRGRVLARIVRQKCLIVSCASSSRFCAPRLALACTAAPLNLAPLRADRVRCCCANALAAVLAQQLHTAHPNDPSSSERPLRWPAGGGANAGGSPAQCSRSSARPPAG